MTTKLTTTMMLALKQMMAHHNPLKKTSSTALRKLTSSSPVSSTPTLGLRNFPIREFFGRLGSSGCS